MTQAGEIDVVIVGAGPYGLSLAAHLRETNLSFRVFGRPMESWRSQMPSGMFLKSEGFASNISDPATSRTLRRFCEQSGRNYGNCGWPIPLETFVEYGLWFQRSLVPEVEQTKIEQIHRTEGRFEVRLDTGEVVAARRVVIACGHVSFRYVPPELEGLPTTLVSHAVDHRDFRSFAGKEVVVLGAGQAALESAALLREACAWPHVVVRAPTVVWNGLPEPGRRPLTRRLRAPSNGLGPGWQLWFFSEAPFAFPRLPSATRLRLVREKLGPAGAWWLRERIENIVPISTGRILRQATVEQGKVRLRFAGDGGEEELAADHVMAGTGYRVDVERMVFLSSEVRASLRRVGAAPALSAAFESSVPGLHFVGLAAANTFGPAMRFVYGTRFASTRLASRLARITRTPAYARSRQRARRPGDQSDVAEAGRAA
jgi:FAD-dependent urate hydroxylase